MELRASGAAARMLRLLEPHGAGLEVVVAVEAEVVGDLERLAGVLRVRALVARVARARLVRSVRRYGLVVGDRREAAVGGRGGRGDEDRGEGNQRERSLVHASGLPVRVACV